MDTKKQFRPQNLRTLLSVLFVIIFLVGGAGFYWGLGIVRQYALDVNQRIADSEASGTQVQQLQSLKTRLAEKAPMIERANQFFSTPAAYQSQLSSDIGVAANSAGLSVASTVFGDINSPEAYTVTITLGKSVTYTKLIQFLSNIETNLPKLTVTSINLSRTAGGDKDSITVGEIKIDIGVR